MSFISSIRSIIEDRYRSIVGTHTRPVSTKTALVAGSALLPLTSAQFFGCVPFQYFQDNLTFYRITNIGDVCSLLGKALMDGACGLSHDNITMVPVSWTETLGGCVNRGSQAFFNATTEACISSLYDQFAAIQSTQARQVLWGLLGGIGGSIVLGGILLAIIACCQKKAAHRIESRENAPPQSLDAIVPIESTEGAPSQPPDDTSFEEL